MLVDSAAGEMYLQQMDGALYSQENGSNNFIKVDENADTWATIAGWLY